MISPKKLLDVAHYPEYFLLQWWRWTIPSRLVQKGVTLGEKVVFYGMPIVSLIPDSQIVIGSRSVLCSVSEFTALGVNHPCVLRTMRPRASIYIGEDTGMSGTVICAAERISIGNGCLLGANVTIVDTDFHSLRPENRRYNARPEDIGVKGVSIGDNVFIGAGTFVLKGASVGDGSVIGGASVVVGDIPPGVIAAGNPARVIRAVPT